MPVYKFNNMKSILPFVVTALVAVFVMAGCKTRDKGRKTTRVKGMDKEMALKKLNEAAVDFNIMHFKGKADFESVKDGKKEGMGFSYKVYIAKDSLLWGSFSKFGVPAASALIDQDSVRMRVSLGKFAVVCDFGLLSQLIGMEVDFGMVQSFFTGDPTLNPDKLTLVPNEEKSIQLREDRPPYQVSWFLNNSHNKLEKMVAEDVNLGRESSVVYSDFKDVSGKKVPSKAVIEATQGGEVRIELEHSTIEIEPNKSTFKFRIPKSYEIKKCDFK